MYNEKYLILQIMKKNFNYLLKLIKTSFSASEGFRNNCNFTIFKHD